MKYEKCFIYMNYWLFYSIILLLNKSNNTYRDRILARLIYLIDILRKNVRVHIKTEDYVVADIIIIFINFLLSNLNQTKIDPYKINAHVDCSRHTVHFSACFRSYTEKIISRGKKKENERLWRTHIERYSLFYVDLMYESH
jgi:hypothetical protein